MWGSGNIINDSVRAQETYVKDGDVHTLLQGKRDIAFKSFLTDAAIDAFKRVGIESIRVPSNPHSTYILFRPSARDSAMELLKIAEAHRGYLPSSPDKATSDVIRRIGQLLEYDPDDIESFIDSKFSHALVAEQKIRLLIREVINKML